MKILVTGGAGYIGYSLIRELLKSKQEIEEIIIYDNLSRGNYSIFSGEAMKGARLRFVQGELLDGRKLDKELQGVHTVYHLAAKVHTPYADRDAHFFEQINHWGTAQLVTAVEQSDVQQFVYLSSISIYGSTDTLVDEDYAPHPTSFYGISKLRGEEHVQRLDSRMKTHIIRSGNVYGFNPALRIDAVINRFMFQANFTGRLTVNGDGKQMRSFIQLDKLAGLLTGLVNSQVPTGIYNAVEHNLSIVEIAEALHEIYPDMEMLFRNQNMKMRQIRVKVPCKILEYLPWEEKSFLEELQEFKERFSF